MVKGGKSRGDPRIYAAADRFRELGFRADRSIFTPDRAVWTLDAFEELNRDFVESPDESGRGFNEKLHDQLAASSDTAKQLMAELLYLHFLVTVQITRAKKIDGVETVLGWMMEPAVFPVELHEALELGVVNPGTYYNTGRWAQLRFLIRVGRLWKEQATEFRAKVIDDPWAFRDFVGEVPEEGAATQRHALLHLLFPDTFEAIVSDDHIRRIIERFGDLTTEGEDSDRQLQEIREALEGQYGESFDFYDRRLRAQWQNGGEESPEVSVEPRDFDELEKAAQECHLPVSYLTGLVELLEDKGQLVLTGLRERGRHLSRWH